MLNRFSRMLPRCLALLLLTSCLTGCTIRIDTSVEPGSHSLTQTLLAEIEREYGFEVEVRNPDYWRGEKAALLALYSALACSPEGLAREFNDYYARFGYRCVITMDAPTDDESVYGEFDTTEMDDRNVIYIHLYNNYDFDETVQHELGHYLCYYVWDVEQIDLTSEISTCNDGYDYFGEDWDSDEAYAEEYDYVYLTAYAGQDAEEDFCEVFAYMLTYPEYLIGTLDEEPDSVLAEKVLFIEYAVEHYTETISSDGGAWWRDFAG